MAAGDRSPVLDQDSVGYQRKSACINEDRAWGTPTIAVWKLTTNEFLKEMAPKNGPGGPNADRKC